MLPGELHGDNDAVIDWMIEHEGFGIERRIVRKELAKRLSRAQNRKHVRNEQGKHSSKPSIPRGCP